MSRPAKTGARSALRPRACLWLALLLSGSHAVAQEPRWYQIEVLFFRHLSASAAAGEAWPERVDLKLPRTLYELPDADGASGGTGVLNRVRFSTDTATNNTQAGADSSPAPELLRYDSVPRAELQLAPVQARLTRSGSYRVLGYHAWRQALTAEGPPLYFYVAGGDWLAGAPELQGHIGIWLRRYLHLDANLRAIDFSPRPTEPETGGATDTRQRVAHLQEHRRLRSNETHYLDHPLIGMIVRINRVE